jgi:two-component system NtrC family sensor kinase
LEFQLIIARFFLLFAFLVNLGLGLLVYLKAGVHKRVHLIFSILAWAGAGWALSFLIIYSCIDSPSVLFWGRMGFATSGITPAAFLCFTLLFPTEQRRLSAVKLFIVMLPSVIFIVLSFTDQIVASLGSGIKMFSYGPSYRFFSIYLIGYLLLGFIFLIRSFKKSIGIERLQVKYCLVGMFLTAGFGVSANLLLPMTGISRFNWLGPSLTVIYVGFATYSIVRHRLMDINIVLKKGTTYAFLTFLLLAPSAILIVVGQKFFFGEVNYLFSIIIFTIVFLVGISFGKIKPRTERAVEQLLFRNRYDYRETLGKFSKAMVTILDLQSLSKRIVDTITQTMGVEKASLFSWNEEKGGYSLFESRNIKMTTSTPLLPKNDALPHYLQKIGEIIIREELAKGANISELNDVTKKMSLLEAEVSIPLILKGQLIGMINLGYKFNKDIYSHEDIELLGTLANQAAIAVENAKLYEDLKRSKSYIRRADRLASLGTLTAGLAHEIRNPLVAIKTLTQLLPERLDDEEFRTQFLQIASGEVDRISSLVNELLDFARPSDPKLELEDINTVLDGMILLVSTETKKKQINIIKYYTSDLPPAQIDREQIKQVFLNILLNAIEATSENGKIMVKTKSFMKPGGEPYIQVEFTDTGCGIPGEYLEDIFNPFFTTKSSGSGLGLSISNQIIQDHRGYIDVESQVGKGASFFINLPLNQEHPKRRKTDDLKNNQNISNLLEGR